MRLPWLVQQAGVGADSLIVTPAPGCFQGYPVVRFHQTPSAIRVWVLSGRPAIKKNGRLDMTCGGGSAGVQLGRPIAGRWVYGQSWPSRLGFGALKHQLVISVPGLPRLLGLAPKQAVSLLWREGFHSHVQGHGREITAQVPGWDLTDAQGRPDPFDGLAELRAELHIHIPKIPPTHGSRTGVLVGAVRFEGGPPPTGQRPPIKGIVALFDSNGRILARFPVPGGHPFRLHLSPGRYLLIDDGAECGTARARIKSGQISHVTLAAGCDIP